MRPGAAAYAAHTSAKGDADPATRRLAMIQQGIVNDFPPRRQHMVLIAAFVLGLGACGGSGDEEAAVSISLTQPNVVSYWNDVAKRTGNAASATNITAEGQRPSCHVDLATVHVAIYDAVSTIDGRYKPFAISPTAPSAGGSLDAGRTVARGVAEHRAAVGCFNAAVEWAGRKELLLCSVSRPAHIARDGLVYSTE
jgi:hypothetical protein